MTPAKHRFRVAYRTVRRMKRAARMLDATAAKAEYYSAVFELTSAGARPLFSAALRCQVH